MGGEGGGMGREGEVNRKREGGGGGKGTREGRGLAPRKKFLAPPLVAYVRL